MLSTLTKLLEQVVSSEDVHTAVLLTPGGELIAFASADPRPKDEVLVLVGLGGEVWAETKSAGEGMVESEVSYSVHSYFAVARQQVLRLTGWYAVFGSSAMPLRLRGRDITVQPAMTYCGH